MRISQRGRKERQIWGWGWWVDEDEEEGGIWEQRDRIPCTAVLLLCKPVILDLHEHYVHLQTVSFRLNECVAPTTLFQPLSLMCAFVFVYGNFNIHAYVPLFILSKHTVHVHQRIHVSVCAKYAQTTFPLEVVTADSTRIIWHTLAGLSELAAILQRALHHSSQDYRQKERKGEGEHFREGLLFYFV